jgi:hypothetical protein
MSIGWIKIERAITEHWIYSDPIKFKWWVTMLINVNYKDSKFALGNKLYDLKKGSSANSLRTWAFILNTGVKSVTSFFTLLENDGMIERKTIGVGKHSTTVVNITNFAKYQIGTETLKGTQGGTQGGTQWKREGNTEEEGKKGKEDKKEINISFGVFWDLYDKKVGAKNKCEKKWIALKDIERQKIIDTLPLFLENITDKKYQPNPETYFNNQRWNDELTAQQTKSNIAKSILEGDTGW